MISRYDDVLSVARDHLRFSNDPRWRNATPSVLAPAPDDYSILLVDPPEHTRLRKVAARVFTKPKLTALAPTIEALADDIVERAARRGHVEWIGEAAQPLAMRVMLRMLGIAGKEEARWQRWSANRARLLEMIATRSERKTAHITGESITSPASPPLKCRSRSELALCLAPAPISPDTTACSPRTSYTATTSSPTVLIKPPANPMRLLPP